MHLADALDFWKGSLFELLAYGQGLHNLAIDMLPTDSRPWTNAEKKVYADLLKVPPQRIVSHRHTWMTHRMAYLAEISCTRDLFLDPDRGISLKRGSPIAMYIKGTELLNLLPQNTSHVVAVYHHVRGSVSRQTQKIAEALTGTHNLAACSYESGTVAMMFFSRKNARIKKIEELLRSLLGPASPPRVRSW
jgi:hypothetical protein